MIRDLLFITFGTVPVLLTLAGRHLVLRWWKRRAERKALEQHIRQWKTRAKCEIIKVGEMVLCECGCGTRSFQGFEFKPDPKVPPLWLSPDGEPAYYGWTGPELTEVIGRRGEFGS